MTQTVANYKIVSRRTPELAKNGKVKRTGAIYYEAQYWDGQGWNYKEFNNRKDATAFVKELA